MKKFEFNKLVRHKLPDRMLQEQVVVNSTILTPIEYVLKLKQKLIEEAEEVSSEENKGDIKRELADVLEVVHALADAYEISFDEVEEERLEKLSVNGYFSPEAYINHIEVAVTNGKIIEYLLNKNRPYKFET